MPTGYTVNIDKMSFEQFTMNCSRAFGALVSMRDESDKEIPEKFDPSDYHINKLEEKKADLKSKESLIDKDWEELLNKTYEEDVNRYDDIMVKRENLKKTYEKMIGNVLNWEPPTKDHIKLKEFMIQQLEDSIKFDCSTDYLEEPKKPSFEDFKKDTISAIKKDIAYHEKGNLDECQRVEKRNLWLKQLRFSLTFNKGE